jgi:hypothetical protein
MLTIKKKYSFFGATIGMRSGTESPVLINRGLIDKVKIRKFSAGGSFVLVLGGKLSQNNRI